MDQDQIRITILENGDLKIETDEISQANHAQADAFLSAIAEKMGGPVTITSHHAGHVHTQQIEEQRQY